METQKRDDKVIFHVCHRLSTLKDAIRYFNNERHGLTHQQSSVLLNRFNTLVRHKAFDDKQEAEVAEQCMDSIASHLYGNVDQLDPITVLHLLKVTAYADKTLSYRPKEPELRELEEQIMRSLPEYLRADVSVALVSLLKLDYYPTKIVAELNQMFRLSIFNKDQLIALIGALVDHAVRAGEAQPQVSELTSEFLNKLQEQTQQHARNFNGKNFARLFWVLARLQAGMPIKLEEHRAMMQRVQLFVDHYSDLLAAGQENDYANVFFANRFVRQLSENSPVALDTRDLVVQSSQAAYLHLPQMHSNWLLGSFELFDLIPEAQRQLMVKAIQALKDQTLDIKKFSVAQLTQMIELVAQHTPNELPIFYKFVESAAERGFFASDHVFDALMRVFTLFVEQGYLLSAPSALHNEMLLKLQARLAKWEPIPTKDFVRLLWCLTVVDSKGKANPVLPLMLEKLSEIESESPLAEDELVLLYQIDQYIQTGVSKGRLPEVFAELIPASVHRGAAQAFEKADRTRHYQGVQKSIALKLLKLRVTFEENAAVELGPFRQSVSFKLGDTCDGQVILLKGEHELNQSTGDWFGVAREKRQFLQQTVDARKTKGSKSPLSAVHEIDVDEWQQMSEQHQIEHLYEMCGVGSK